MPIAFSRPILAALHEVIRHDFLPNDVTLVVRAEKQFFRVSPDRHIAQIHVSDDWV